MFEWWSLEGGQVGGVRLVGAEAARGIDTEGEGNDTSPDDCSGEGQQPHS